MCTPAVASTDQEAEPAFKRAVFWLCFLNFACFFLLNWSFCSDPPLEDHFSIQLYQATADSVDGDEGGGAWGKNSIPVGELVGSAPSRSITQVDCELDSPPVQLQAQRVGRLLRGGGHQQPEGPLGHEAEGHVLGLGVHRPGQDHLQVHAAVVAHHSGVCKEREREPTAPHPHSTPPGEEGGGSRDIN